MDMVSFSLAADAAEVAGKNKIELLDVVGSASGMAKGYVCSVDSGLDLAIAEGIRYVVGVRAKDVAQTLTLDANKTLYIFVNHADGVVSASETDDKTASNSRLCKCITDGSNITSVDNTVMSKYVISIDDRIDNSSDNMIVDEDDMISNSETNVPSQQSVKAYVDSMKTTTAIEIATADGDLEVAIATTAGNAITVFVEGYPVDEDGGNGWTRTDTAVTVKSVQINEQICVIAHNK